MVNFEKRQVAAISSGKFVKLAYKSFKWSSVLKMELSIRAMATY